MSKKLTATAVARYERDGLLFPVDALVPTRFCFALVALFLAFSAAGCADRDTASDNDNRGVFYGGVTTGGTRP